MNEEIENEWKAFVDGLTPEQRKELTDAGFNIYDINDDGVPKPHRYIYDQDKFCRPITINEWKADLRNEENNDGVINVLSSIIAKVIDALDCTTNKEVLMHNDCIRLALGYRTYKSMADVAKKYDVKRATISWRVKQIQKRLNIEPSIYMRCTETCEISKQSAKRRKK